MPYEITGYEGFIEVNLSGETSKYEILQIVGELARRDPQKDLPDLWILAADSQIPFPDLIEIAEAIKEQLPVDAGGKKSAFVVKDEFHKAQLGMYVSEASILRLDMKAFLSRDDAISWIMSP